MATCLHWYILSLAVMGSFADIFQFPYNHSDFVTVPDTSTFRIGGKLYTRMSGGSGHTGAQDMCKNNGHGDLASMDSGIEYNMVTYAMEQLPRYTVSSWIAGRTDVDAADTLLSYSQYSPQGTSGLCIMLGGSDSQLYSTDCGSSLHLLCEKPAPGASRLQVRSRSSPGDLNVTLTDGDPATCLTMVPGMTSASQFEAHVKAPKWPGLKQTVMLELYGEDLDCSNIMVSKRMVKTEKCDFCGKFISCDTFAVSSEMCSFSCACADAFLEQALKLHADMSTGTASSKLCEIFTYVH